jgi:hypothetical protein
MNTTQPESKLSRERSILIAVFIVIVGYIFVAAPDPEITCQQNMRAATNMSMEDIRDVCER